LQDNEKVLRELGWKPEGAEINEVVVDGVEGIESTPINEKLINMDLDKLIKPTIEDYDKAFMEKLRMHDSELYYKILEMESMPAEAEEEYEPFVPLKPSRTVDPWLYEPPEDDEEEEKYEDSDNGIEEKMQSNPQDEM
jgi:hypothetical protein